jgi:hypothetical protein
MLRHMPVAAAVTVPTVSALVLVKQRRSITTLERRVYVEADICEAMGTKVFGKRFFGKMPGRWIYSNERTRRDLSW